LFPETKVYHKRNTASNLKGHSWVVVDEGDGKALWLVDSTNKDTLVFNLNYNVQERQAAIKNYNARDLPDILWKMLEQDEPAALTPSVLDWVDAQDDEFRKTLIQQGFVCSISNELMLEPVRTADGQIYDKPSIEAWFKTFPGDKQPKSPLTNLPLANRELLPATDILERIKNTLIRPEEDTNKPVPSSKFKHKDRLDANILRLNKKYSDAAKKPFIFSKFFNNAKSNNNETSVEVKSVSYYAYILLAMYDSLYAHRLETDTKSKSLAERYQQREKHFGNLLQKMATAKNDDEILSAVETALKDNTSSIRAFTSKNYMPLLNELAKALQESTENSREGFNLFVDMLKKENPEYEDKQTLAAQLLSVLLPQQSNNNNMNKF
jgi:hypothetical protein